MTDKDELFKGIDEAANNLFDRYIVKKPESPPAAVPELELEMEATQNPESEPAPAPAAPKPETAIVAPPPPAPAAKPAVSATPSDGDQLFGELEEALLTIDWDVSRDNLLKGREILARLVAAHGWATSSPVGQITVQMDKVLASMLDSPENSPVSAPNQLKKALKTIRNAQSKGGAGEPDVNKQLAATLSDLQAVLTIEADAAVYPSQAITDDLQAATPIESLKSDADLPFFDLGLETDPKIEGNQPPPGEVISGTTTKVLKSYAAAIADAIKLLTPMVNLFESRPAMAKIHSATKQLKAKLILQQGLLGKTFSADFSAYNGLGTMHGWLESQLDVLRGCVSRIGKLEKLFGKTAGYEKLFSRCTKIRKILEKQADAITIAVGGAPAQHQFDLTGEYPAVIQPASYQESEAPAAAVSAVASPETMIDKCIGMSKSIELNATANVQDTARNIRKTLEKLKVVISGSAIRSPGAKAAANAAAAIAGHSTKCRWDWLLKTSWGGQLVGLAPEQVAFESKSTFAVNSFKDLTFFNLKKLKPMPWSSLHGLFSGEMAELDKSVLNDMELEIANPPASFPGSSKKKVYLVIMYSGGRGKVYLIDTPTEAISVAEEALWVPGTSTQSDIAGTLTVYGSTMPVVSID
jgi:hypothetical protein